MGRQVQPSLFSERKPKVMAKCHSDRPVCARGMCSACYQAWFKNQPKDRNGMLPVDVRLGRRCNCWYCTHGMEHPAYR